MSTHPMGWSESPVALLSMPATAISPPMIATTISDATADSTGNQARVLSDLRTAHERLAISHEVWNRLIDPQYRSCEGSGEVGARSDSVGTLPEVARYVAPGRVNLMGDHTDYNEGFVLPLAIDR